MSDFRAAISALVGDEAFASLHLRFPEDAIEPVYGLTGDEHLAIAVYTHIGGYHLALNRALWGGKREDLDPALARFAAMLERAITKLPCHDGIAFRGYQSGDGLDSVRAQYQPGNGSFIWPAFTSATRQLERCVARDVLFVIRSKSGRILCYVSEMADEDEVLFPPGCEFAILRQLDDGEKLIVELEEV